MALPIRWKMTLSALMAITIGLMVAGWLTLRSIERLELTRLEETLTSRTALAAAALQPVLESVPLSSAEALQAAVKKIGGHAGARVTLIRFDGVVLADSETADEAVAQLENHRTRPEIARALATGRGTDTRLSATTGKRMFYLALPISSDETNRVIVRLAVPMTSLD